MLQAHRPLPKRLEVWRRVDPKEGKKQTIYASAKGKKNAEYGSFSRRERPKATERKENAAWQKGKRGSLSEISRKSSTAEKEEYEL